MPNEMLEPGQVCDLTCFCKARLEDHPVYWVFRLPNNCGNSPPVTSLTVCHSCGDKLVRGGWEDRLRCLEVATGNPVDPPPVPSPPTTSYIPRTHHEPDDRTQSEV